MKISAAATFLFFAALTTSIQGKNEELRKRVPQDVLDEFDEQTPVRKGIQLNYHRLVGNMLTIDNDTEISLKDEDLEPMSVMTTNSRVFVDGDHFAIFQPMVFRSRHDPSVIVTKDLDGQLISASVRRQGEGRGKKMDVLQLSFDTYVTVDAEDMDDDKLAKVSLEGHEADESSNRRALRSSIMATVEQKLANSETDRRSLQSQVDVIDIDIVADNLFCAQYGGRAGRSRALARIESIVAEASTNFEGFGIRLEIGTIMLHCNPVNDPISGSRRGWLPGTRRVCGTDGALDRFRNHVANVKRDRPGHLNGDLIHLFYGYSGIPGTSVGCAYRSSAILCSNSNYNLGVNEMTFSPVLMEQAGVLSHEIGHNLNQEHTSSPNNLMYPSLCRQCTSFNSQSIATFQRTIDRAPSGCIQSERGGRPVAPRPTPAPTAAPPRPNPNAPAPGPAPSCSDSSNFFVEVNGGAPRPLCEWVANPGVTWTNTAEQCRNYGSYCRATCRLC